MPGLSPFGVYLSCGRKTVSRNAGGRLDDRKPVSIAWLRAARWGIVAKRWGRILTAVALLFMARPAGAEWTARAKSDSEGSSVVVAFDGAYRVGRWTAVKVPSLGAWQLETVDGDGVRVRYTDQAELPSRWRYVIPGRASAPLVVRRVDPAAEAPRTAEPVTLQPRFGDQPVAEDRRWVLVLGDSLGIDELGANALIGREGRFQTTVVREAEDLPDHSLGYQAIDTLVITASGLPLLKQLDDRVRGALRKWVEHGGRVVISLGASGQSLYEQSELVRELIPFQSPPLVVPMQPVAIEAAVNSDVRLERFEAVTLPTQGGEPLLIGRTQDRLSIAFAMRYRYGFGQVFAIAAALDEAPFADWPQRSELLTSLVPALRVEGRASSQPRLSSEINYRDIAGQLRATLDRFESFATLPFAIVAAGLMILFVLVGPFDFWLVNRWLGRPLLGWISFPLLIAVVSIGLVWFVSRGPRRSLVNNRFEVIDINAVQGSGRGFRWDFVYAPQAERFRMQPAWADATAGLASELRPLHSAPYGFAGPTFGGVELQVEDPRLPAYDVAVQPADVGWASSVVDAPLAAASSKGVGTWWDFPFEFSKPSRLERVRRTELRGPLSNPLPVDVLDGMLLDRDTVYMLPSRFRAGDTIRQVEDLRPRVFRWLLTGRKQTEELTTSERWNQADDRDLKRLGEVLTFYGEAGGESYTGLTNVPLERLDLSGWLTDDRVLLIGRLEEPATEMQFDRTTDDAESEVVVGKSVSIVRVLLPVEDGGS